MQMMNALGMCVGRLLISIYFIWTSFIHFLNIKDVVELFEVHRIPSPHLTSLIYVVLMALGGLLLFFGLRAKVGAFILIVLSFFSLFAFHHFWQFNPMEGLEEQKIFFLQHLAMIGGLFYALSNGSGAFSIDTKKVESKPKKK